MCVYMYMYISIYCIVLNMKHVSVIKNITFFSGKAKSSIIEPYPNSVLSANLNSKF